MDKLLKSIYFKRYKHFEKIYFQAWKNLIHRNPHVKKKTGRQNQSPRQTWKHCALFFST